MTSLLELYFIFAIMGLAFGGSISINSLYLQEFLQKRHRASVLTVAQTIEGMTVGFVVVYFLYITKYWQGWYWFGLGLQVIILFGMLWLPESPEFYFAKGRFDEAKDVLLKIARINGRPVDAQMIKFDHIG